MERLWYYLHPPWPEQESLNQLYCLGKIPIPFQQNILTSEKGGPGSVPSQWTSKLSDYYKLSEFIILERLERGVIHRSGPFRVIKSAGEFAVLQDRAQKLFSHPKWIVRKVKDTAVYHSTIVAIWSDKCACEESKDSEQFPAGCLRNIIYTRFCRICTEAGSNCEERVRAYVEQAHREEEEQQDKDLLKRRYFDEKKPEEVRDKLDPDPEPQAPRKLVKKPKITKHRPAESEDQPSSSSSCPTKDADE
ncbi:hypothetical protein R1sor_006895 [Riccia sorocarpa]|uniref:Uncharacterized protein n=1 Tax=Riccia sorocarpa TaxID=122646 RepID=A0ABD3HV59_9MARC